MSKGRPEEIVEGYPSEPSDPAAQEVQFLCSEKKLEKADVEELGGELGEAIADVERVEIPQADVRGSPEELAEENSQIGLETCETQGVDGVENHCVDTTSTPQDEVLPDTHEVDVAKKSPPSDAETPELQELQVEEVEEGFALPVATRSSDSMAGVDVAKSEASEAAPLDVADPADPPEVLENSPENPEESEVEDELVGGVISGGRKVFCV